MPTNPPHRPHQPQKPQHPTHPPQPPAQPPKPAEKPAPRPSEKPAEQPAGEPAEAAQPQPAAEEEKEEDEGTDEGQGEDGGGGDVEKPPDRPPPDAPPPDAPPPAAALAPKRPGKKRGLKPTPRAELLAAKPFTPGARAQATSQVAYIPKKLDLWGNGDFGVCVTSEEMFAKACHSPEIFVPADVAVEWARRHGWLDGAELLPVMEAMQTEGIDVDGQTWKDGEHLGVNFASEKVLQAAIATGPVKIGIDADALPPDAGDRQGWSKFGGRRGQFSNEDHCVSVPGFGPGAWLCQLLGVGPPHAMPAGTLYLVFSWGTIGLVDFTWLMSTCGEAWVRNPTTVEHAPAPPPPPAPGPGGNVIVTVSAPLAPGAYSLAPAAHGLSNEDVQAIPPGVLALLRAMCDMVPAHPPKWEEPPRAGGMQKGVDW